MCPQSSSQIVVYRFCLQQKQQAGVFVQLHRCLSLLFVEASKTKTKKTHKFLIHNPFVSWTGKSSNICARDPHLLSNIETRPDSLWSVPFFFFLCFFRVSCEKQFSLWQILAFLSLSLIHPYARKKEGKKLHECFITVSHVPLLIPSLAIV